MMHLGLSNDDFQTLVETLADTHRIRVTVDIYDADENEIDSLTFPEARIVDGAIQMDTTADVSRSASMVLLDPLRKLPFDPKTPAQGSLFAGYFIHVHYGVWVSEAADWVDIPVFYGPLTSYEHTNETIQIEAQGKEALLLGPHFAIQGYTIRKGTRLDDAIRRVGQKAGERRFDIPDLSRRLNTDRIVTAQMEPWKVIQGGKTKMLKHSAKNAPPGTFYPPGYFDTTAAGDLLSIGDVERFAFYDGRGRLCIRKHVDTPKFTFDEGWITQAPTITYDLEQFVNYVHVKGVKGKGAKKAPHAVATLPNGNPLSGQSLARDGVPRFLALFVKTQLTTGADCYNRAEDILHRLAGTGINASFSSLPMPLLEEGDRVRVETRDYDLNFDLKQWTLPLTSASDMSVGSNKRVPMKTRRKSGRAPVHPGGRRPGNRGGHGHRAPVHPRGHHHGR